MSDFEYLTIDGNWTVHPVAFCKWHKGVLTKKLMKVHKCEQKNCKRLEYCDFNTEVDKLDIKIKYLSDIDKINKLHVGDWVDLRAGKTVEIKAGEYAVIPLGVAMELPKGYEALVLPRSSTFKKYGVIMVNSMGVIDESYCGDADEWCFIAYALRDTVIPKNERICQFRVLSHQPQLNILEVDHLGNANRGGIGSTGRV